MWQPRQMANNASRLAATARRPRSAYPASRALARGNATNHMVPLTMGAGARPLNGRCVLCVWPSGASESRNTAELTVPRFLINPIGLVGFSARGPAVHPLRLQFDERRDEACGSSNPRSAK